MKILVTGASGFLGRFLCKALREHDVYEVNSKNCDLTKQDSLLQFQGITFDQIYHLAAWTQAGDFCLYHLGEQWIINQQINTNVLSWWKDFQPQAKIICMGTSCSYSPELPLLEENYLKGKPIDSLFTYAMTKRMLLSGLIAINKQFGLDYLYLIPSTLYGPHYHTDTRQLHFIFDLMRKILRAHLYEESVLLWGDGYQKRELVHVRDFISIMLKLVETQKNEMINVGATDEHSIREFAEKISMFVHYDPLKIEYDTSKYVGAKSKVLITDKLKSILPEYKMTSINDGFEETIQWYLNNKDKLLKKNP